MRAEGINGLFVETNPSSAPDTPYDILYKGYIANQDQIPWRTLDEDRLNELAGMQDQYAGYGEVLHDIFRTGLHEVVMIELESQANVSKQQPA